MSILWSKILGFNRREQVIANLIIITLFYPTLFLGASYTVSKSYGDSYFSLISNKYTIFLVLLSIAFTHWAYKKELSSKRNDSTKLKSDEMFYEFGAEIKSLILSLQIPESHKFSKDKPSLVDDIFSELADFAEGQINADLKNGKQHYIEFIQVFDGKNKEKREFIKFCYEGDKGGMITHFIHFQTIGNYLTIYLKSYSRGIPHWYERYHFYLMSPFRIIFWIIPWFRNQFSIMAEISKHIDNKFEVMDLQSYFKASQDLILDFLQHYLKEKGLLTKEGKNKILYQIYNYGNQIQIDGSNNEISGSIFQKV